MACEDDCGYCGKCAEDLEWERQIHELSERWGHDKDNKPIYAESADSVEWAEELYKTL